MHLFVANFLRNVYSTLKHRHKKEIDECISKSVRLLEKYEIKKEILSQKQDFLRKQYYFQIKIFRRERRSYITRLCYKPTPHIANKPFQCCGCGNRFVSRQNVRLHLRMVHGKKNFKCDKCDYVCARARRMKMHNLCIHLGEKPYACDKCFYAAVTLRRLQLHQLSHASEKPYKCDVCQRQFTCLKYLKRHQSNNHSNERFFKCDQCPFSSLNNSGLQRHLKTHTGEKPHKCNYCDYASTQMSNVKNHTRQHTGEKPYKCKQCDYASTHNVSLKNHVRKAHSK